jgi:LacI family transcriptional regulator
MNRRPTVKDVADAAGVSVATVSRALSGARAVKPEHRETVIRTAERLGYQPHSIARALRSSRTGAIGMVVPKIDNPFFPQLVSEAERVLQAHDLALLLCSSDDDAAIEARRMGVLAERQVDGMLVAPASQTASAPALAAMAVRLPVVQFDQRVPDVRTPFVGVDDAAGISAVIDHLVASGRTRLAFIGADEQNWSGKRRRDGFEAWARSSDPAALERMSIGDFTRDFGYRAALGLLRDDPRIEALVCANDLIALGALDAASELGIPVPTSLAITGFDDINVATACRPTLTTVRQPVTEIVETAVSILLGLIGGAPSDDAEIQLPVELIIRGSA